MLSAKTVDNPTWRTAIHYALLGSTRATFRGWGIWRTTQRFSIEDIEGVVGLKETNANSSWVKSIFRAVLKLKDGRYCYIECNKGSEDSTLSCGWSIFSRDFQQLLSELHPETIELLKLNNR